MKRYYFTLTELLVTIGIIIILAGLAIPAVLVAQQKGRVTAAKADMNAILTALKGVEGTYHKMVNANKDFGGKSGVDYKAGSTKYGIKLGGTDAVDAYDNFIVELSDPSNAGLSSLNINRRKIKFLDPKSDYDPAETIANNKEHLWRDPWGNPYVLIINTDFSGKLPRPYDTSKFVAANAIMYSFGPDGEDNNGQSTDYDDDDGDDICSWR